jgi:hypothetical protein
VLRPRVPGLALDASGKRLDPLGVGADAPGGWSRTTLADVAAATWAERRLPKPLPPERGRTSRLAFAAPVSPGLTPLRLYPSRLLLLSSAAAGRLRRYSAPRRREGAP